MTQVNPPSQAINREKYGRKAVIISYTDLLYQSLSCKHQAYRSQGAVPNCVSRMHLCMRSDREDETRSMFEVISVTRPDFTNPNTVTTTAKNIMETAQISTLCSNWKSNQRHLAQSLRLQRPQSKRRRINIKNA